MEDSKRSRRGVSRRAFLAQTGGGVAAAALPAMAGLGRAASRGASQATPAAPNILVVLVDQLRYAVDTAPVLATAPPMEMMLPNLTALRNGFGDGAVNFTQYYAAATDCSPARATLVTGLYAPQSCLFLTEVNDAGPTLNPGFPTFGGILSDPLGIYGFQALGYETLWFGKWHLSAFGPGPGLSLSQYGFTGFNLPSPNGAPNEGVNGVAPMINDAAIAQTFQSWISGAVGPKPPGPWCATVSLINPHDIAFYPGAYCGASDQAPYCQDGAHGSFPPPSAPAAPVSGYFTDGPSNWEDLTALQTYKPTWQTAYSEGYTKKWGPVPDQASFATMLDYYLYMQMFVDAQIGAVIAALRASPYANNTIIVFTADHGEYGGAHGLRNKGAGIYDESIHVPFHVYVPPALRTAPAAVYLGERAQMCSSVDVTPFLLTLASGSEAWRTNASLKHLAGRQSMSDFMDLSAAPRWVRQYNGQPYILHTTDEAAIDEAAPGPKPANFPTHVEGYRDANGKLGLYSFWKPCSLDIDPSGQQVEFYDYTAPYSNVLETMNNNTSPNRPAFESALSAVRLSELRAPLPTYLQAAHAQAESDYLAYLEAALNGACPT